MKQLITKANVEVYCETLEKSIDQFISYCEEYPKHLEYYQYLWMAKWVKDNYKDKIALHILSFASSRTPYFLDGKPAFPGQTLHFIYDIRMYVFDNYAREREPLSLLDQNRLSKEHIHFDFSVRKPKTISTI